MLLIILSSIYIRLCEARASNTHCLFLLDVLGRPVSLGHISRVSEFIAWVGVPIVLANFWLTAFFSAHFTVRTIIMWSAFRS